jgi:hypothetical protein
MTNGKDSAFSSDRQYGLTKREYFSAMAMQGILAKAVLVHDSIAELAVKNADALIEELNKESKDED